MEKSPTASSMIAPRRQPRRHDLRTSLTHRLNRPRPQNKLAPAPLVPPIRTQEAPQTNHLTRMRRIRPVVSDPRKVPLPQKLRNRLPMYRTPNPATATRLTHRPEPVHSIDETIAWSFCEKATTTSAPMNSFHGLTTRMAFAGSAPLWPQSLRAGAIMPIVGDPDALICCPPNRLTLVSVSLGQPASAA